MVLVGVTGPVGSGKTSVLSSLAEWCKDSGKTVDGFLALSLDRPVPEKGAREYVLHQIASATELTFARRDESLSPPYQIDQKALATLTSWAAALKSRPPLGVLILDEFGPIEARGQGHMTYWRSIEEAQPEVVIIAVRDFIVRDIERRIALPFDVVIDAASPGALEQLQILVLHHSDWTRVGNFGAAAGGFEATVGSALHQSRIPMTGLFMSAVQSLIMMYAGDRLTNRGRVMWVSFISAGLKALSPFGGRLRPMLAITVQGFLFTISVTLLGWNVIGILAGAWLVGAWAALQGVVLQYVIIGDNLFPALDVIVRWVSDQLHLALPGIVSLIAVWTILWGVVSSGITLYFWQRRHRLPARLTALLAKGASSVTQEVKSPTVRAAIGRGVRDLIRPLFWAPVAVVAVIIVATGSSWEQAMWMVVRAIAVGWVLFSVARLFDPRSLVHWLRRKGQWGPAMALSRALRPRMDHGNQESEKKP